MICVGCEEERLETEIKLFRGDNLCRTCRNAEQLNWEFYQLEEQEMRLTDEIMELNSSVEYARRKLQEKEELVNEARKRYNNNQLKMAKFDWSRTVVSE